MIYYLLLDRKERYPSCEDQDLPPRNDVGENAGWAVQIPGILREEDAMGPGGESVFRQLDIYETLSLF